MRSLNLLATVLVIVGGLNWGLVAIAEFDLMAWIFGEEFGTTNAASRLVYGLVGLGAVDSLATLLAARRPAGAQRAATATRGGGRAAPSNSASSKPPSIRSRSAPPSLANGAGSRLRSCNAAASPAGARWISPSPRRPIPPVYRS
jgi:uncharacterized membrane protein YuzA (DUF378 family)